MNKEKTNEGIFIKQLAKIKYESAKKRTNK